MDTRLLITIAALTSMIVFSSCYTEKRPAGFPTLYPASITVTQDNEPLADAFVELYSADDSVPWLVSGVTESQGVAKLVTHGEYFGAPAGNFKVCVTKTYHDPVDPEPTNPEDWKKWSKKYQDNPPKSFALVENLYGARETTPLFVEITAAGKNDFVLDVGKAIKQQVK